MRYRILPLVAMLLFFAVGAKTSTKPRAVTCPCWNQALFSAVNSCHLISVQTLKRGEHVGLVCDNQSPEFFSVRVEEATCQASTAAILHTEAGELSHSQVSSCIALLETAPTSI